MSHEHPTTPEQHETEPRHRVPVFNLNQMTTEEITSLVTVLGYAYKVKTSDRILERDSPKLPGADGESVGELWDQLDADIGDLPAVDVEQAVEVYSALTINQNEWPRLTAAHHMGKLLQHVSDEPTRQRLLRHWLQLSHDDNGNVVEAAHLAVDGAFLDDQVDQPTKRFIWDNLPEEDRMPGYEESLSRT